MPAVAVEDVDLIYHGIDRSETIALQGLGLGIESGSSIAVIGPSGCGKSTLLELMAGLRKPTSGRIEVGGQPVDGPRLGTGYIPQGGGLLPWRDALANVALPLVVRHVPRSQRVDAARQALARVGLADRASAYPAELSGGMRQRLALARCLAADCDLILADEPFSALDALTREQMQRVVLDLWTQLGYTQVMVTHSVEEAVWLGQRIVVLTAGPGQIHSVVDNPRVGLTDWRGSTDFANQCAVVRAQLADASRTSPAGATP